jgi:putative endonuclease
MTSTQPPAAARAPSGTTTPTSRAAAPRASTAPRPPASRPPASRPPAALRPAAALGRYGEALAVRYLREQGMEVLERNWRCAHGEVDVVARDGRCLVIVEVKTRRSSGFGEPVEAVTFAKAVRLRRLAAAYLAQAAGAPVEGAPVEGARERAAEVRVDVVGILCRPGRPAVLRHVVGVGS